MAEEKQKLAAFDSKAMIEEHAAAGTKIKYNERKEVEIVKETAHYKVGQKVKPHKIMADALVKQGIAKEVKK
ncbi:MAG TPA: hypothetical protein VNX40_05415 [Mucilaginibacter sp.]|jgi:hypothetical protein|nr:hypothetical protein [Mucilaginibacter sp.]